MTPTVSYPDSFNWIGKDYTPDSEKVLEFINKPGINRMRFTRHLNGLKRLEVWHE